MGKIVFHEGGLLILGSNKEEDLKAEPDCPNPGDLKCECCRKHVSELEPYGKDGHFKGAYLIRTHRPCSPYDEDGFAWYGSSWESKDCVILSEDASLEKRFRD